MEKLALDSVARAAVDGDPRALAQLLEELEPLVVRTVRLIVGPGKAAAEDAAQEALTDLARRIGTLRNPESVVAWTARIATRRALRAARFERLRRQREATLEVPAGSIAEGHGRSAALSAAFDRLPRRQRSIAVLRLYLGLSEAETAEALGISAGAVKSQLHAARRRLAEYLHEAGFAPSARAAPATKGTT
jgi:RNA polymerase sigma-70 factor (ECF subfamily)